MYDEIAPTPSLQTRLSLFFCFFFLSCFVEKLILIALEDVSSDTVINKSSVSCASFFFPTTFKFSFSRCIIATAYFFFLSFLFVLSLVVSLFNFLLSQTWKTKQNKTWQIIVLLYHWKNIFWKHPHDFFFFFALFNFIDRSLKFIVIVGAFIPMSDHT